MSIILEVSGVLDLSFSGCKIRRTSKSYLYLLGGIRLRLNLYLAQVNTFNLFSLYGLGLRYIEYRLIEHQILHPWVVN
ncbi:hypothetical protein HanXRQr2_Chr12g0544811 [Helianthus annuus]|uniref:Uncharacterized protein n=1 Tax=Helianthus annuus TaxID=4232 RepID=A0A9K3MWA6_HELAN|nr:hypothetical protein HanXRQr2_Chr12g0544811 [Helianthus annuus]